MTGDVLGVFAEAVEFFARQLDRDIGAHTYDGGPETPREYYEDVRGWEPETVEAKRLGYAPADPRALRDHLMGQGYDLDTLLATGLFYEDEQKGVHPHFRGRYVFPYFDRQWRPVYAISRSLDEDEGGHAADHHGEQKYTKAIKGKDYSAVDEPIYGAETVDDDTDRLLVAGGIADAIALHEAGYAAISPVTTVRFKRRHEPEVRELVEDHEIEGVYQLNDAERPTVDAEELQDGELADVITDVLTIQQFGEGLRGAFGNVEFLQDTGATPYLAELPGGDDYLRKLDPDDYLQEEWGTVETLLASARPASDHAGFAEWDSRKIDRAIDDTPDLGDGADESSGRSAIYDLDITDVTGLRAGERAEENPLGHHGNSYEYYVVVEERAEVFGYDHKYNVAYNGLTYLLCAAGERPASRPNGSLDDAEVFAAWEYAKREDLVPDDDPIPRKALRHVAREYAGWGGELIEHETRDGGIFEGLPAEVYNAALDVVRNEIGLDPGRTHVGVTSVAAEPEVVLPPAARDLSTTASGWDWRRASETGEEDLTVERARERTVEAIADAYERGDRVLVEALPTMGKSYGAVKAAAETGQRVTVLTGRGREEQYAQYKEWCDEFGLSYYTLPAFTRDCDTANGEHGDEWAERVRDWYRRGATPKEIHKSAEYVLDEPLPCQRHDGHRCPYASAWDFDPDEFDVLIGHYSHAHKSKVTGGRVVVFDEYPDAYETTLFDGRLQGAVSYWLENVDSVPFDDYTDLVEHRDDPERRGRALDWFLDEDNDLELEADELSVFDDSRAHAAAPVAAFTLLAGEDLGNGFEYADLQDAGTGAFDRSVGEVAMLRPPELRYASGVVALDGTPTLDMWRLALGERLNHRQVLQPDERGEYVRDALNLQLVRTTEAVKPYNSADHVTVEQDAALLEKIGEEYDERPALITSSTAEAEYAEAGVLDDLVDESKHYGNVLGSNEFDTKRVGAVVGSNHYGDRYIKKWGAYAGRAVERDGGKGRDLSYGGFGDKILTHMREHDTLQAAMRFGRDGNGAVVHVHTNTLPEWVPVAAEGRVVRTWSDGMRQVLAAAEELNEWTTADLAAHPDVEIGERQVLNILHDLAEQRVVECEGREGRFVWQDGGLHRVSEHGDVELEPIEIDELADEEVDEIARNGSIYTWDFVRSRQTEGLPPGGGGSKSGELGSAVGEGPQNTAPGDPPPG